MICLCDVVWFACCDLFVIMCAWGIRAFACFVCALYLRHGCSLLFVCVRVCACCFLSVCVLFVDNCPVLYGIFLFFFFFVAWFCDCGLLCEVV